MEITRNTRIFVAGCGGMLGEAFYERFAPICEVKATDIDVNAPWLTHTDVRDFNTVWTEMKNFNPHVIVNLAAMTDMEACEQDPERAWLTNSLGAENLALIASKLDATYIFISSAGIFDGKQDCYSDFDAPNPVSVYAKSKFHGEICASQYLRKFYVVRAGWMMGGGPAKDKKFINKIYKQIVAGARQLNVVDDKAGTPTYTYDFAAGLQKLLGSDLYGVYNQVCGGFATRYDLALEFVRLLGLENEVEVRKVGSDFFSKEYFAPRPGSEKLVNMKLDARGLNVMRDWRICLREYSQVFAQHLLQARVSEVVSSPEDRGLAKAR